MLADVYTKGMETTNTRNESGVKDSSDCYRNTKGGKFEQWSDFYEKEENMPQEAYTKEERKEMLEFHQKANPTINFKIVKIYPEGFYRIYSKV